jgi:hypothetical protein
MARRCSFPFFLALSSLILYVCLPLRVQYISHIQSLQHISQNNFTRQQFRCGMRLDGSHPSRTIPRMKTQPRIGPRRLFEERRKDRFKKSGWTTFLLLTLSSNTVAMLGTDPYGDSRPLSQLQLRQNYSLTPDSLAAGRWPVVTSKRFLGGGRSGASAPPARPTGCLKNNSVHAPPTTPAQPKRKTADSG